MCGVRREVTNRHFSDGDDAAGAQRGECGGGGADAQRSARCVAVACDALDVDHAVRVAFSDTDDFVTDCSVGGDRELLVSIVRACGFDRGDEVIAPKLQ